MKFRLRPKPAVNAFYDRFGEACFHSLLRTENGKLGPRKRRYLILRSPTSIVYFRFAGKDQQHDGLDKKRTTRAYAL